MKVWKNRIETPEKLREILGMYLKGMTWFRNFDFRNFPNLTDFIFLPISDERSKTFDPILVKSLENILRKVSN